LTLLEAQACGAPVIGPDVPGTNECVRPAHGGVLYRRDCDAEELAALALETLADSDRMRWRRVACVEFMHEQFTVARMTNQYVQIYRDAPYPRDLSSFAGVRARHLLAPWHWGDYVKHGWSVGLRQLEAAGTLTQLGEWKLARIATRASLLTAPTIYVRPRRMSLLMKTHTVGYLARPKR
jgi:hypothetical protein